MASKVLGPVMQGHEGSKPGFAARSLLDASVTPTYRPFDRTVQT
jgi:hypothetical protein